MYTFLCNINIHYIFYIVTNYKRYNLSFIEYKGYFVNILLFL